MIKGDYWILPSGELLSIAGHEHGWDAKRAMLGVESGEHVEGLRYQDWLTPLTPDQVEFFSARRVPRNILDYLQAGKDPRKWVIENWDWIRIHDGRNFGVKKFDDKTLSRIQDNAEFWRLASKADPWDTITVEDFSENATFTFPLKVLKSAQEAEALKHYAAGVGRFRNPQNAFDATAVFDEIVSALNDGFDPDEIEEIWRRCESPEELFALHRVLEEQCQKQRKQLTPEEHAALWLIAAQVNYAAVMASQAVKA